MGCPSLWKDDRPVPEAFWTDEQFREQIDVLKLALAPLGSSFTLRQFADAYWKPHIDRQSLKRSTKAGNMSVLKNTHLS